MDWFRTGLLSLLRPRLPTERRDACRPYRPPSSPRFRESYRTSTTEVQVRSAELASLGQQDAQDK